MASSREKACILGSGNWGSAIARIVGANAARLSNVDTEVKMWVFEEVVQGRKLTEIINSTHENVKYLPGHKLPENVVAVPDILETVRGASVLIFVIPHQFLARLMPQIRAGLAPGAKAISLIKGMDFDANGPVLISDIIRRELGIDVSILMGANVANEVAADQFCEATIGAASAENGAVLKQLFHAPSFLVSVVPDPAGVEICGALKNIVALAAGFVDGLGLGGNSKAAIIRIGLSEMMRFCSILYPTTQTGTFFESCGVADLITTCYGGRNRKCAEAFVRTGKPWEVLEAELLNGQKLQGTLTCSEIHQVLLRTGHLEKFPFFRTVHAIAFQGAPVSTIVSTQYYA